MDHERKNLDAGYVRALGVASLQIGLTLCVAALVLDGGVLFRAGLATLLIYLAMLVLIATRRPYCPTAGDLVAIKCGYLLLYPLVILLVFATRHSAVV